MPTFAFGLRSTLTACRAFTLLELLVAMSIMTVLFGIGLGAYSRLTGQMEQVFTTSDAKQLISATILEARRSQVPMLVHFSTGQVSRDVVDGEFTMQGSQNTLVGYWSFNEEKPDLGLLKWRKGINRMDLEAAIPAPTIANGILGKCVKLDGGMVLTTQPFDRLNCSTDFYLECRIKPDLNSMTGTYTIYNGGSGTIILSIKQGSGMAYLDATGLDGMAASQPYPDDGLWHKVGLFKCQGLGIQLYLDDALIATKVLASSPNTDMHAMQLGQDFKGSIDEVKFYKIGQGTSITMKGNGLFFGFESENFTSTPGTRDYFLMVSPLGVARGLFKSNNGDIEPVFKVHSYVHMQDDLECVVDASGFQTNDPNGGNHIGNLNGAVVRSKDSTFPDSGYAWVRDDQPDGVDAAEIVRYEVYDGGRRLRVLGTNELGTDGKGNLGTDKITLRHVGPITITRMGDVY